MLGEVTEMTKEIEIREDWHRLTGMGREGLILASTGIARLQGRDTADFEDMETAKRWAEQMCGVKGRKHVKFGICTHCKHHTKYFYEYDNKTKKMCAKCLFRLGNAKGELIEIDARCIICDVDLKLRQVQTHLQTEHPSKYAIMMKVHKKFGEDEKEAYGKMLMMAVERRYRDEKDEEKMKRLHILDKQLEEMGIHVLDSEEIYKRGEVKGMPKEYLEAQLDNRDKKTREGPMRETKCSGCGKPVLIPKDFDDRAFCNECALDYVHHMEKEKACLMCGKKIEGEYMGSCADCAKI
jgi:hypothetical protein